MSGRTWVTCTRSRGFLKNLKNGQVCVCAVCQIGASGDTGFSIFLFTPWEMGLLLCQISRLMFNSDLEASHSFDKGELCEITIW